MGIADVATADRHVDYRRLLDARRLRRTAEVNLARDHLVAAGADSRPTGSR